MAHTEAQLMQVPPEGETRQPIGDDNPLAVVVTNLVMPPTQNPSTYTTEWIVVPGIVSGAAYTSGDQMGAPFWVPMGCTGGVIQALLVIDLDKEQLAFDVLTFQPSPGITTITAVADNAAADFADADHVLFRGHIPVTISDYAALNDTAVATVRNVGLPFTCPNGRILVNLVSRGAPNYTDKFDLSLAFVVLPDARTA